MPKILSRVGKIKFLTMNLLSKLKVLIGVSTKKKTLPPVLVPKCCPLCGCYMEKRGFGNLAILREINMAVYECGTCKISYHGLTGHQTNSLLVADKCRKLGYKIDKTESDNYIILNQN